MPPTTSHRNRLVVLSRSGLTLRISRQNAEIRRFPIRNPENRVISQASDKQRKFEISYKVTKKRVKCKGKVCFSLHCRDCVFASDIYNSCRAMILWHNRHQRFWKRILIWKFFRVVPIISASDTRMCLASFTSRKPLAWSQSRCDNST